MGDHRFLGRTFSSFLIQFRCNHVVAFNPMPGGGERLLTRRAHGCESVLKIATALLPVVQVCAATPLRKAGRLTPSSNSARATFIRVPTREMVSFRGFAAQAEASCKHGDVNPTACQDPPSTPATAALSLSPLAIADARIASGEGGRAHRGLGGAGQGGAGPGGADHGGARLGRSSAANSLRWIRAFPLTSV